MVIVPLAQKTTFHYHTYRGETKGNPKAKDQYHAKHNRRNQNHQNKHKNQDDSESEVEHKIEMEIFETDSDMEIQSDSAASELSESSNDESDAIEDHCDGSLTWSRTIRNVPLPQFTGQILDELNH